MINNNEEKDNNSSIKIEEVELNPERYSFENKLRNEFSKEDVIHNFDIITENKTLIYYMKNILKILSFIFFLLLFHFPPYSVLVLYYHYY